jgi:lysophospholipase L1-like esterase
VELFARAVADSKHITFVGSQADGPDTVAGVPFPKDNEGHPGWVISQISAIANTTNALVDSPQIILLHIGTNDMDHDAGGATDRLASLIDQITAASPNSLLAVAAITPYPLVASNVAAYNAAIRGIVQQRVSQGKHVLYVDMYDGFPSDGLTGDGIHPNDAIGYPWMADNWYSAIKQYLH